MATGNVPGFENLSTIKQLDSTDGIKEFFDLYFKYIGRSEAPLIYHRWSIIGAISALLSRNVWLKFGDGAIYPNLYLFLIGEPGARKSFAITRGKKASKDAGFNLHSAARTSPEKLICDLEENGLKEGGTASQVFICEDEFYDFIGTQNENFISLLTKLFDNPGDYPYRLKNSTPVNIDRPTVSILGGCTYATFTKAFPPDIIDTGFLSRIILIYSDKTKERITWPGDSDIEIKVKLIDTLKETYLFHSGQVLITPDANAAIDAIYQAFEDLDDRRFAHYCSRRHTHLLKLCIIMAAIERSLTLKKHHVVWANTLLCSVEDRYSKALGEFGKSKNADISSKIMQALYTSELPVAASEIWKLVQTDLNSLQDLQQILTGLLNAQRILHVDGGWLAVKKVTKVLPYTDFSLLHDSEIPVAAFERDLFTGTKEVQQEI